MKRKMENSIKTKGYVMLEELESDRIYPTKHFSLVTTHLLLSIVRCGIYTYSINGIPKTLAAFSQ